MQWFHENVTAGVWKRHHGVKIRWNNVNLHVKSLSLGREETEPVFRYCETQDFRRKVPECRAVTPAGNRSYFLLLILGLNIKKGKVFEGLEHCIEDYSPAMVPWSGGVMHGPGRGHDAETEPGEETRGCLKVFWQPVWKRLTSLRFVPLGKLMCFSGVKCPWLLKCAQHLNDVWESESAEQRWALIPVWV